MAFTADFFDGISARAQPVHVRIAADNIVFDTGGKRYSYKLATLAVQAQLGRAKRLIDLPDGGRLEAYEISALEAAIPSKTGTFWRIVHYLENHLGWVLVSLIATVCLGWAFIQYGVPVLAKHVADATPPSIESQLGEQILKGMDAKMGYFKPSKIEIAHQDAIRAAVKSLCDATKTCPQYRLEFRESEAIGANAFAIPGSIVIITDDLIKLSKNDTEIVAVLAHELGHVKKRHAFRQSLQGALSGLLLAAATGDVSSMASSLPGVLVQMRYTRALETEADAFALESLQKACLPPKAFADILLRLTQQAAQKHETDKRKADSDTLPAGDPISDMLSSHPDTLIRIQPFLSAKSNCPT